MPHNPIKGRAKSQNEQATSSKKPFVRNTSQMVVVLTFFVEWQVDKIGLRTFASQSKRPWTTSTSLSIRTFAFLCKYKHAELTTNNFKSLQSSTRHGTRSPLGVPHSMLSFSLTSFAAINIFKASTLFSLVICITRVMILQSLQHHYQGPNTTSYKLLATSY